MTRRALAALFGAVVVAAVAAGPASAHAYLVRTVPGNGTSVHGAPRALTLVFDEDVSSALSRVTLVGARSGPVPALRVSSAGGSSLAVDLPPLAKDLYRVEWHTVSADDLHATGGTLVFGVDTSVPASVAAAGKTTAPGASVVEVLLRWEDFTAIAVLVGALALLLVVVPAAARRGAARVELASGSLRLLGIGGAVAALVSGVGLLYIQIDRAGGFARAGDVLTGTTYGHAWIARETVLVLVAGALLRSPGSRALRIATATLGVAAVVPFAIVSHAASVRGVVSIATAALALHILAAALWVGGVLALCVATVELVRAGERASARTVALCFGRLAVVSVATIAITGIGVLGIHVRSLDALGTTQYGRTLLIKTGLFLLAGAIGLATTTGLRWNRAPERLRTAWARAPRVESLVLVAALVPAALLTASAPARQAVVRAQTQLAAPEAPKTFASVGDLIVSLAVEPNRPGPNFLTVTVTNTRRPARAPIHAVSVSVAGPGGASRTIGLAPSGTDEWQAVTRLSVGEVGLSVAVKRPGLPDATMKTARVVTPGALPSRVDAREHGFTQRPLEPMLKPFAIGGAAVLLLVLLAGFLRARIFAARPPLAAHLASEPRPRGADR